MSPPAKCSELPLGCRVSAESKDACSLCSRAGPRAPSLKAGAPRVPRPRPMRGAVGPRGRVTARRGRGGSRGGLGEVFGFFWRSRGALRKLF